ncbi:hypothetical protein SAMN05421841_1791 [Chryseobacterium wanjuense]|uniref:Uncharacterized protein n=1 Tax=Chryseobacterium wanjuense TaxID=356305 RepID=A0A1I0QB71_9FLAO|nr:hypothetical protein [Chryseobacterium wanjuense]SEW24292.1 hypothetical protein SAMN05421841_1791 [Chryseobacterium wanjuense]
MTENESAADPIAENTPTQTLFRFVSLRSPQLSDEKDQDKRFIFFPEQMKSDTAFYEPVTEGTGPKQKLLRERAEVFKTNADRIESLTDFKAGYPELYTFAIWLAVNKTRCTYEEFEAAKQEMLPPGYLIPEIHVLWNNLIYQVVTQENFYLKETLIQMLLALHTLSVTGENDVLLALAAKVVLPKELMLDDNNILAITSSSKALGSEVMQTLPTDDMKKQQEISAAKTKLSRIELLNRNLSAVIKQYKKDYETEFKIQNQAHQERIIPILEEYNKAVADSKQEYCSTRPPGTEYNPEDPCQQLPVVPFPRLPEFEFKFKDEVSAESLVTELKPENLEALLDVLGYTFDPERESSSRSVEESINDLESVLEGRNTFGEINTAVDKNVEELNNLIVQSFQGNEEVYKSIGGILIPASKTISVPFTFQVCPNFIYKGYTLNLALNVPDSSWDVNLLSYALTPNGTPSSIDGVYFVKTRTGNTIFLNDLYSPGLDFYTIQDSTLRVKVVFANGRVAEFTVPGVTARACNTGDFVLQVEEGEDPVIIDDENNFIPSGFGFKNIGVADYLKVEQSTHAYVEGEVAHIENVMAREYREKSTRRLRRSENTTTTSSDTEREQLTDTTTANRFEMQSEISKMAQEARDMSLSTHFDASWKTGGAGMGASFNTGIAANFANHTSKEESTRQATIQAQDITARAMDRIVTKIHEERIEKIIDEFEESNSHGLDNRKGDKHVVGVYRWVDKLMKNQIYNYGIRTMFEFMIPEPARLHLLGMKEIKDPDQIDLIKPVDPRAEGDMQISDYSALANEVKLKYWMGKYNAELDEKPMESFSITKAFTGRDPAFSGKDDEKIQVVNGNGEVLIPEGYTATNVEYVFNTWPHGFYGNHAAFMSIAGKSSSWIMSTADTQKSGTIDGLNVKDKLEFSFATGESPIIQGALNITCRLTQKARNAWQQKTFNAIINAYEDALIAYNNAKAEADNKAVVIKDSNPNFYRQIENTVLRKNCISYMADRATDSTHGYGLSGLTQGNSFNDYETVLSSKLDKYTAFVKFMEQAFEWDNLSYYLYPYYWGKKQNWVDLYQSENTDPLFRNFLQSGMARVIVTVRPGFEDAVQFYLATGKIWNGGEVPVIGDELYLSIVDEMKEPKGKKEGKAWLTRIPTTLNILQAESIGLKVAHALPFTTENPDDFEVPSEVITPGKFNFEKNDNLLGIQPGEEEKIITGDWL